MRRIILILCLALTSLMAEAQNSPASENLTEATIVFNDADAPLVKQMAQLLADVPIDKSNKRVFEYTENYMSQSPINNVVILQIKVHVFDYLCIDKTDINNLFTIQL